MDVGPSAAVHNVCSVYRASHRPVEEKWPIKPRPGDRFNHSRCFHVPVNPIMPFYYYFSPPSATPPHPVPKCFNLIMSASVSFVLTSNSFASGAKYFFTVIFNLPLSKLIHDSWNEDT